LALSACSSSAFISTRRVESGTVALCLKLGAASANDALDRSGRRRRCPRPLWATSRKKGDKLFVSTTLVLEVPVLSSLPRLHNSPLAKCGCKKHTRNGLVQRPHHVVHAGGGFLPLRASAAASRRSSVRRRARCWCAKCRQCASSSTTAEASRSGVGPGMQCFDARNTAARPRPCADAVVMASVGPFGFAAAAWSGRWPECRAKCITRYGYAMTCRRLTIVC